MTICDFVHCGLKLRRQGSDATTQLLWSGLLTLFLSLFLAAAPTLHSQAIYGSINGTVTDSSGAVVSGATITVTDIDKGTEKIETTNGVGLYYGFVGSPRTILLTASFKRSTTSSSIDSSTMSRFNAQQT